MVLHHLRSNNFQLSGIVLTKPNFKMVRDRNGNDMEVAIFNISQTNTHPKTGKNYQKDFLVFTYNREVIAQLKKMEMTFEVGCVGIIQISRRKGFARYMLNAECVEIMSVGKERLAIWEKGV